MQIDEYSYLQGLPDHVKDWANKHTQRSSLSATTILLTMQPIFSSTPNKIIDADDFVVVVFDHYILDCACLSRLNTDSFKTLVMYATMLSPTIQSHDGRGPTKSHRNYVLRIGDLPDWRRAVLSGQDLSRYPVGNRLSFLNTRYANLEIPFEP